jgi:DNA-directed RNA polymerase beta subunit
MTIQYFAKSISYPAIQAKSEGTYYHVQTYGKGMMGSYASQLNRTQRWMIAKYIKSKQATGSNPAPTVAQGDTTKSVRTQGNKPDTTQTK